MARSKRFPRGAVRPVDAPQQCCTNPSCCKCRPPPPGTFKNFPTPTQTHQQQRLKVSNCEITQEAVDRHWEALPPTAKAFILGTPDGIFGLDKLLGYWGRPDNAHCLEGGIAASMCGATWYLALVYVRLKRFKEARALTINGAFIHQCYNSSVDTVRQAMREARSLTQADFHRRLPHYCRGFQSIRSPDAMEKHIRHYLPKEYTQMMTSFANLSQSSTMSTYINQINDDWMGTGNHPKKPASPNNDDGSQIQLVLVDDADDSERQSFDIGSTTTLKSVFNDYADKRGISLRTLRFSYGGRTLFLSSAGSKTPEQLGMHDGDEIMVHDTSKTEEQSSSDESSCKSKAKSSTKKGKAKKRSKKAKGKKPQPLRHETTVSLEECKIQHSERLTEIHEQAEEQFKAIRQRLNNLTIERKQPKKKLLRPRSPPKAPAQPIVSTPSKEGLGGKAGKSRYVVQIGEVRNLYKTTKPSARDGCACSEPLPTLDLHGHSREEARAALDATLEVWVDEAMRGSYPFVRQAEIVCGCGSQVLSETVSEWIRENERVRNAPSERRHAIRSSRAA